MAEKAIRVGVLGTGLFARRHLAVLATMPGVTVAAICGVDTERTARIAHRYGATPYTAHLTMLEREHLDALYVVIPPDAHTGQELDAVEHGVHLFVEKPVALDLDLARRTTAALDRRGLIGSVGYNWRYLEGVDDVKRRIAPRDIALATGYWIGGLPRAPWWRRRDRSGGQVVEQTTHIIDLARYVLGEVATITAMGVEGHITDVPDYSMHDASAVSLRFTSGAIASIVSSCLLDALGDDDDHAGLELIGHGLWVKIGRAATTVRVGRDTTIIASRLDPYAVENALFIAAVRSGDPGAIRAPYADAVRTLQVTSEATQAMEDDAPRTTA